MFDNLLHQDRLVLSLMRDLEGGHLARSMLFTGDANSGKLTAALELARILGCKNSNAPWSCKCRSCNQHRLLESPYMLLMGQRNFLQEIRAAGSMLVEAGNSENTALRFLYYRNVQKLLRRFDSLLWQDEGSKLKKAESLISGIQDRLGEVHPLVKNFNKGVLSELNEPLAELHKLLPADGISINMIRRATYWSHTADSTQAKVVIIENAHEMNDAARNAFLKTLEEPPGDVYFILITERPGGVLPTIRSRLREYAFAPRGVREYRNIISRIYRYPSSDDYRSLQAFFSDREPGGLEQKKNEVALMFKLLREQSISARDELSQRLGSDRNSLRRLISLCLEEIHQSHVQNDEFIFLQKKLEDMYFKSDEYNIPVASALEHGYI